MVISDMTPCAARWLTSAQEKIREAGTTATLSRARVAQVFIAQSDAGISSRGDILSVSAWTDISTARHHTPMDYPIRLADQLRAHLRSLRKQRGLTQAQLGQRLGLGQVRIAEIEARPGLVSVAQLVKLLSALGAGLVLRDLEGGSAAAVAGPVPKPASSAPGPAGRKGSGAVTGKARGTTPSLRIPAKKGSW